MSIHTFGDSHSLFGWNNNIKKHHLGAILCYSFGNEKLKRCDISRKDYNIKDGDIVIFCFGEIDCRCHIHKYVTQSSSYQTIIENIVYNYIEAIKLNIQNCNKKLKHVCIYNVVPPTPKNPLIENKDYPFLGTNEERKQYHLYFNICIQQKCKENNFIFFDIYDKYKNSDGFLNSELSDGNVHIKNSIYLDEFITNFLL